MHLYYFPYGQINLNLFLIELHSIFITQLLFLHAANSWQIIHQIFVPHVQILNLYDFPNLMSHLQT